MTTAEHPLPAQQHNGAVRKAEGFATPKQDKKPQCARMLPKRVLPIIFLPGIMGSNLRMSAERQKELHQTDNIAWRPDRLGGTNIRQNAKSPPRERQLRLDPLQTTADIYDPSGPSDVSGDGRHDNVLLEQNFNSPMLMSDPTCQPNGRTAVQKARARGWGEVFFKSYGVLLQHLESRLNNTFFEGKIRPEWRDVVGVDPQAWSPDPRLPQQALTEEELKKVATGCWFAVYAFGYNWLQSNGDSAKIIATRINKVIEEMNGSGYECNQVIVVTHSMGGLVGRALVHPKIGKLQDKVLGIVHGVMPAIGAPAAYKRMRAGFEDPGLMHASPSVIEASLVAKVLGNYGDEVTAVLANAPGGLQLLPSESYGNGWLRVRHNGHDLEAWPKKGDPYNEVYKVRGKWYALFREDWINPSGHTLKKGGGTFERTCRYLDQVQSFHQTIANTYHPNSYAHYGADPGQQSFGEVVWEIRNCADPIGWQNWPVVGDSRQGTLEFTTWDPDGVNNIGTLPFNDAAPGPMQATILPPSAPGDQTVPAQSADHQLHSGMFKGVFRQTGYEHQSSYKDPPGHRLDPLQHSTHRSEGNLEMLKGIPMQTTAIKRLLLALVTAATLPLAACDHNPRQWKTPNMTSLTPRLQPLFENTKTVCFGRFMVDVPASATVAWGNTIVPLTVSIYPNGVDEVKALAKKFIEELKTEKAIYLKDIPLLISMDDVHQPEGQVVTGYDGFEAIGTLKINGYFRLNNDGVVINARPLIEDKDGTIADIKSMARRLRQRAENEVPTEPGNCIENAFLPDSPDDEKNHPGELISIGFRLKEFPDAHFSIRTGPSNPYDPEGDSLKAQWKRIKEDPATPEEQKLLANIKYFRESPRQIHDWKTGYEVLVRNPDEKDVHSYHDFEIRFTGVPHDPFKPYADIQFQTGVADNAAGATRPSLTDEEAIAVWDKITSTIRVRPTSAAPTKSAAADARLQVPLGELAATGRTCPQTGWWVTDESGNIEGGQRQHFRSGERMPHVVSLSEPSLWQKLKGERPSYRTATVWKLVAYGDAPAQADMTAHTPPIAQASPDISPDKESSPKKKG